MATNLYPHVLNTTEKPAVVLDIGSAYTKCGFAGEPTPRGIFPTTFFGRRNQLLKPVTPVGGTLPTDEDWEEAVEKLLNYIFFHILQANPHERRVVICESLLVSNGFRKALAYVLFIRLGVVSIFFAPNTMLSLYPCDMKTGIVVDCGYLDTRILPIYEGIALLYALGWCALASEAVHTNIGALLAEHSLLCDIKTNTRSNLLHSPSEPILEDIKAKLCFVMPRKVSNPTDEDIAKKKSPVIYYPLSKEKRLEFGNIIREDAMEVLFEGLGEDISISTSILDSLKKVKMDMRYKLIQSIVLVGGTTMIPGFISRVEQDINYHLANTRKYESLIGLLGFVKLVSVPFSRIILPWLGGSIIGALDTLNSQSLARKTYLENGHVIPDWTKL